MRLPHTSRGTAASTNSTTHALNNLLAIQRHIVRANAAVPCLLQVRIHPLSLFCLIADFTFTIQVVLPGEHRGPQLMVSSLYPPPTTPQPVPGDARGLIVRVRILPPGLCKLPIAQLLWRRDPCNVSTPVAEFRHLRCRGSLRSVAAAPSIFSQAPFVLISAAVAKITSLA